MPTKSESFVLKQTIAAPPAEVYRMFTHSTAWRDWFCDWADVSPRLQGGFHARWEGGDHLSGHYTALLADKKIAWTWAGRADPAPTQVTVTLSAKGDQTAIKVTQAGIGSGAKWAATRRRSQSLWAAGLENLKSMLETGIDLRVARRPRLGIFIGDFNPAVAQQLGVPARDGIRLEGTAEGSGARASGLQKDDVIVKFAGQSVNLETLGRVVSNFQAGDKVPVMFYRGKQKLIAQLELSKFPTPDIPATAAELGEAARKIYAQVDADWAQAVAGLSEAEAEHKANNEWSVKELIAHFIAGERDYQSWIANMLRDNETNDSLEFRPNMDARLGAIVKRFKTVSGLLAELNLAEAETVDLLSNLPAAFVARKHLYRRVALWALQVSASHFNEEHGEQLKTAIAAARSRK
jgi:uncharacterized protein YndB with AHSA1/START domain